MHALQHAIQFVKMDFILLALFLLPPSTDVLWQQFELNLSRWIMVIFYMIDQIMFDREDYLQIRGIPIAEM